MVEAGAPLTDDGEMEFLGQPAGPVRLGDWLTSNLAGDWQEFRAAVAFVKRSGVRRIAASLASFAESKSVEMIVGVDHQGTSYEGLSELLNAVSPQGRVVVFHNRLPHTFHPKIYLFKSTERAEIVVGSGNLTRGGLYTNYEAGLRILLDLGGKAHREVLDGAEATLDAWMDERNGTSWKLSRSTLDTLVEDGLVVKEAEMPTVAAGEGEAPTPHSWFHQGDSAVPFQAVPVRPAPAMMPSVESSAVSSIAPKRAVRLRFQPDPGRAEQTYGGHLVVTRTDGKEKRRHYGSAREALCFVLEEMASVGDARFLTRLR